ncbi:hypothetical protein [Labilibaculum antarcticum]|uniref:Uncharacterized protein n=1 Tax=Labilibaculum antarcticum TaxID=1717717 RepID=A0A1Y1CN22_9BACT|nr:hypothetical protein [Labilibaculum antarcticum]BAX81755.1 hypothetical protein ALGA_3457 [Labilibaculum antarcticum]
MKNKVAITFLLILLIGSSINGYSQNVVAQRLAVSERSIPKIVSNTFKKQYPDILLKGWYVTHLTYWQNDYSSDWYNGWYGQRTVVVYTYQKPNYFEVEFVNNPGELSRAIYNINGYWYETRTQIKGLTMGIHNALKESKFNAWKISTTKEKLESPAWPIEIYRFGVSKGLQSQIISIDAEGNFIQMKELKK